MNCCDILNMISYAISLSMQIAGVACVSCYWIKLKDSVIKYEIDKYTDW